MDSQIANSNLNIYFVIPKENKSEQECSDDMWEAFNKCDEYSAEPKWIKESECININPVKSDVFVIEEFSGETFEMLKNFKSFRIVGPRCVISCLDRGEPLPEGTSPVLNTAMKKIIVTFSGFSIEEKERLRIMIEYMGGLYIKQLRSCTTHVVTNSVMTAKYEAAAKAEKVIVTEDWIDAIWKASLNEYVSAEDSRFDVYKCPVFWKLVVTSTNLHRKTKDKIKSLIESNGGIFSGVLDGSKVKVVLTVDNGSTSEKLKYAMQNKIPCLRSEWIEDSIQAGYALPLDDYVITSTRTCSTPEKVGGHAPLEWSAISAIHNEESSNAVIQETLMSTRATINCTSDTMRSSPNLAPELADVDKLDLSDVKKAGPFLDGCNIYLIGFPPLQRDKLNKIISIGSATRLDEPSEALTHVIVGDSNKGLAELKRIHLKELSPYVVNVKWLLESIKLRKPALESAFSIEQEEQISQRKTFEPSSPLSKKNLEMMHRSSISTASPSTSVRNLSIKDLKIQNNEESDLVMKYLRSSSNSAKQTSSNTTVIGKNSSWNVDVRTSILTTNDNLPEQASNVSSIPMSQSHNCENLFFHGVSFSLKLLDEEEIEATASEIRKYGGQIQSVKSTDIADFAVVPFNSTLQYKAKAIVTQLYIDDCINQNYLLEVEYYHKPIAIEENIRPLKNCVIAISTYLDIKRDYFQQLSEMLGALYQDTFSRTTKEDKGIYANTHLICPSPQGKKYNAAVKWKVPAVTCDWLLACLKNRRRVEETPFLVGESSVQEEMEETLRNTEGQKLPEMPGEKTPVNLINKRLTVLKNQETPIMKSPFHVDTPTSPYGRIFGNENPSPNTRKYWLKWTEDLPDMHSPPVKKNKRKSTPLSELKRQLLEKIVKETEIDVRIARNSSEDSAISSDVLSKRKLSYSDEENPVKNAKIDPQIVDLKQALRNASDLRESLSAENMKRQTPDDMDGCDKFGVIDSQRDTVGWENLDRIEINESISRNATTAADNERKRKFMLSGIKDRQLLEEIIIKLGGEVSNSAYFDMDATHLLCLKPARNEKMLGSIASGKWVLHANYLTDCDAAGEFLDEEEYEYGNPKSRSNIPEITSSAEQSIATAAYRWRVKLSNSNDGAFKDMVAILFVQSDKYDQFERLIQAGGGAVIEARPPYDATYCGRKISHCFVQTKQKEQPVEWAMLASKGILCYQPQFLGDCLTAETPLNHRDFVLPEFRKYLALVPT